MEVLFKWFFDLIMSIENVWEWFTIPINIFGYHISPLYLISGSLLIVALLRAIL